VPQHDLLPCGAQTGAPENRRDDRSCGGKYGGWQLGRVADAGFQLSIFAIQTQVRKALQLLLDEHPGNISIVVQGDQTQRAGCSNSRIRPLGKRCVVAVRKKKDQRKPLQKIALYGFSDGKKFARAQSAG